MEGLFPGETLTKINDGLSLIQNRAGLLFGTDALLLAAFVRRMPHAVAAEFGAGSGVVSLLLAGRDKLKKIYAVEVQDYYADLTKRNAALNGLSDKVEAVAEDLRAFRTPCEAVFTNPPYRKTGCGKRNLDDGKYAARHEVYGDISDFCSSAAACLKFGGLFTAVYRPDRAVDLLFSMREARLEPKRLCFVSPCRGKSPCLFLVEGKRGASPGCEVLPPFFLQEPDSSRPTEEAKYLYDTGEWPT